MPDTVTLKSGLALPSPGFGTWRMGETPAKREAETAALARAIDLGFTHIDTAEMYGEGKTESLLGEVLRHRPRDRLFLTSKVYPWNAAAGDMVAACERSLKRLGTDYLDLYLLHWPGSVPLESTLEGARRLKEAGKIRAFGISNFDTQELSQLAEDGLDGSIEVNQVMYNPARRGIEFDLMPLMKRLRIACVAYTPIEPHRLSRNTAFAAAAARAGLTPVELAMAWHMTRGAAVLIPKTGNVAHVEALYRASQIRLTPDQLTEVDRAFPPPTTAEPLDMN